MSEYKIILLEEIPTYSDWTLVKVFVEQIPQILCKITGQKPTTCHLNICSGRIGENHQLFLINVHKAVIMKSL